MVYEAQLSGWQDTVVSAVRGMTAGVQGGGKAFTARVLDNLHARYIAAVTSPLGPGLPRYDTAAGNAAAVAMMMRLAEETGYSTALVRAFLVSLYAGVKSGKVPEEKYDPVGSKQRRAVRQQVDPSGASKVKGILGMFAGGGMLVLVAGGAVAVYLLSRKGK